MPNHTAVNKITLLPPGKFLYCNQEYYFCFYYIENLVQSKHPPVNSREKKKAAVNLEIDGIHTRHVDPLINGKDFQNKQCASIAGMKGIFNMIFHSR